jgi:hypothetical protein
MLVLSQKNDTIFFMADILPEKWMKVMAVTTTALGVIASIALSRSSFYITRSQHLTALEESQWAYYQAKSIKQDLYVTRIQSLQLDLLGAASPGQRNLLNQTIENFKKDIARYDLEKVDIKKGAEAFNKQNALGVDRGSQFSLAVVFAQIGILLSSVGVLLNRRALWLVGLLMGGIALVYLANGFLLFLKMVL